MQTTLQNPNQRKEIQITPIKRDNIYMFISNEMQSKLDLKKRQQQLKQQNYKRYVPVEANEDILTPMLQFVLNYNLGTIVYVNNLEDIPTFSKVVIRKLSDISYSMKELLTSMQHLIKKNCEIYVCDLQVRIIDLLSLINVIANAQEELLEIRKLKATSKGNQLGRPKKSLKATKEEILEVYDKGRIDEAIKLSGVSKTTFYRYINEWKGANRNEKTILQFANSNDF